LEKVRGSVKTRSKSAAIVFVKSLMLDKGQGHCLSEIVSGYSEGAKKPQKGFSAL